MNDSSYGMIPFLRNAVPNLRKSLEMRSQFRGIHASERPKRFGGHGYYAYLCEKIEENQYESGTCK